MEWMSLGVLNKISFLKIEIFLKARSTNTAARKVTLHEKFEQTAKKHFFHRVQNNENLFQALCSCGQK